MSILQELSSVYRVKLTIAYDGTLFLGWQKSKEGLTVEEALEIALQKIKVPLLYPLEAASRTDRGVHAAGQIVGFTTSVFREPFPLLMGLNLYLPKSIRIKEVEYVPLSFHPTLENSGKEYLYKIINNSFESPFERDFAWYIKEPLDLSLIQKALPFFIGKHSFKAFCNQKKSEITHSYEREIFDLSLIQEGDKLTFRIFGNSFLYKMVRNIVGTLVYVGLHKLKVEEIPLLFESEDRKKGGITAPPQGLYLNKVFYN